MVALRNTEHSIFTSAGAGCASSAGDSAWRGPDGYRQSCRLSGRLLASCPPGVRRDIYLLEVQPGSERISQPHIPNTIEHIIIAKGRALVGPVDSAVELDVGDYITYPGDELHIFRALEADTMALLVIEHS